MAKKQILVVGVDANMLAIVVRLINQNPDWEATGAGNVADAERNFSLLPFDLVLLTNGLSDEAENDLRQTIMAINATTPIVQHYGGGSGLLENELRATFDGLARK